MIFNICLKIKPISMFNLILFVFVSRSVKRWYQNCRVGCFFFAFSCYSRENKFQVLMDIMRWYGVCWNRSKRWILFSCNCKTPHRNVYHVNKMECLCNSVSRFAKYEIWKECNVLSDTLCLGVIRFFVVVENISDMLLFICVVLKLW